MAKIFLFCIATHTGTGNRSGSTPGGDVIGYALSEDGKCLASHLSSSVDFSKHDMGLTSNWKHEYYKEYDQNYELEWIDEDKLDAHPGYISALAKNHARYEQEQKERAGRE